MTCAFLTDNIFTMSPCAVGLCPITADIRGSIIHFVHSRDLCDCILKVRFKGKVSFYIAQYPVSRTAQSALHCLPYLEDLFIPTPFSASPVSILAMQQLRATT